VFVPADLCRSHPFAVVCHHNFSCSDGQPEKSHIVELNFGYVSDKTRTLPCSSNATLNPLVFTNFTYLCKLSFHKCFNNTQQHLISLPSFPSSLKELVFIDNPSVVSPLHHLLHNGNSLKKLILVRNGFQGELPPQIARNNLSGKIPASLGEVEGGRKQGQNCPFIVF